MNNLYVSRFGPLSKSEGQNYMDRKTKLWKRTEGVKKEDSYKDATQ